MAVNELRGDAFTCADLGGNGFPVPILYNNSVVYQPYCPITNGNQLISAIGAYKQLQYYDTLVLVGFWIGMMLIFLAGLRFLKHIKR